MKNSIRRAAVLLVLAVAIAGCNLGGPTVTPPAGTNPGPGPGSSPSTKDVKAVLGKYEKYAVAEDWEKFAGLYEYPLTLGLQLPPEETTGTDQEIREDFEADREQLLQEVNDMVVAGSGDFAEHMRVTSIELTGIRDSEGELDDDDSPRRIVDLLAKLEVANAATAQRFLPMGLFQLLPNDVDPTELEGEDSDGGAGYKEYIVSLEFDEPTIAPTGSRTAVVATATTIIAYEWHEDEDPDLCTMVTKESFTLVRSGSGWKIEEQVHLLDPTASGCDLVM